MAYSGPNTASATHDIIPPMTAISAGSATVVLKPSAKAKHSSQNPLPLRASAWAKLSPIERHAFYARAQEAYCVVATSETALYANLILKKGVVSNDEKRNS